MNLQKIIIDLCPFIVLKWKNFSKYCKKKKIKNVVGVPFSIIQFRVVAQLSDGFQMTKVPNNFFKTLCSVFCKCVLKTLWKSKVKSFSVCRKTLAATSDIIFRFILCDLFKPIRWCIKYPRWCKTNKSPNLNFQLLPSYNLKIFYAPRSVLSIKTKQIIINAVS